MIEKEVPKQQQEDNPDVNFVKLSGTRKPVVDYAGMIVVGADVEEFPELKSLPNDTNE